MGNKECSEFQVIMLGLDGVGKTTILHHLKLGEIVTTIPTEGFNCQTVNIGKNKLAIYDYGGMEKVRKQWNRYYEGNDCLVFVFDGSDEKRMEEGWKLFSQTLQEMVDILKKSFPVLILLNKQDLSDSIKTSDFITRFKCCEFFLEKKQMFNVQECSGVGGDGLKEGFKLLSSALSNNPILQDYHSKEFSQHLNESRKKE